MPSIRLLNYDLDGIITITADLLDLEYQGDPVRILTPLSRITSIPGMPGAVNPPDLVFANLLDTVDVVRNADKLGTKRPESFLVGYRAKRGEIPMVIFSAPFNGRNRFIAAIEPFLQQPEAWLPPTTSYHVLTIITKGLWEMGFDEMRNPMSGIHSFIRGFFDIKDLATQTVETDDVRFLADICSAMSSMRVDLSSLPELPTVTPDQKISRLSALARNGHPGIDNIDWSTITIDLGKPVDLSKINSL